jgi:hypothetical protein
MEGIAMNDSANCLDQADEEILAYNVSDEALEAAAGKTRRGYTFYSFHSVPNCQPSPC